MAKSVPVVICMRNRLARDGISQILKKEGYCIKTSVASIDAVLNLKIGSKSEFILLYAGGGPDLIDPASITSIKNAWPNCFIVLLLENCRHEQRWQIERLGVAGVLLQSISSEVFAASLRLVTLGEHVFSVPISIDADERSTVLVDRVSMSNGQLVILPEQNGGSPSTRHEIPTSAYATAEPKITRRNELSDREIEILACLVAGNSNKLIARLCNITEATVKAHLKAILRKTEVVNRTQAAVWALNNVDLNGKIPELRGAEH